MLPGGSGGLREGRGGGQRRVSAVTGMGCRPEDSGEEMWGERWSEGEPGAGESGEEEEGCRGLAFPQHHSLGAVLGSFSANGRNSESLFVSAIVRTLLAPARRTVGADRPPDAGPMFGGEATGRCHGARARLHPAIPSR